MANYLQLILNLIFSSVTLRTTELHPELEIQFCGYKYIGELTVIQPM